VNGGRVSPGQRATAIVRARRVATNHSPTVAELEATAAPVQAWRRVRRPNASAVPPSCSVGHPLTWLLLPEGTRGEGVAICECAAAGGGQCQAGQPAPPRPIWRLASPAGVPRLVPVFESQAPTLHRLARLAADLLKDRPRGPKE
jgi:hypothetical protein